MRNYERLSIEDFGQHLIESGDLDPVYIMLYKAELEPDRLARWLIAYWCLYHVGASCYISEATGREFWMRLRTAAINEEPSPTGERWPRGHERRHWRGLIAKKAVGSLMGKYLNRPEEMLEGIASYNIDAASVSDVLTTEALPFKLVSSRVQSHESFGPWMAFKVADMIDRLNIASVSFDNAAVFMFDDPTKAALKLFRLRAGIPEEAKLKDATGAITKVVDYLTNHFKDFLAPPLYDRQIGLQEVETILCKWKSHMNGHYPLNNDIVEIDDGLKAWMPVCETARLLRAHLPEPLATN